MAHVCKLCRLDGQTLQSDSAVDRESLWAINRKSQRSHLVKAHFKKAQYLCVCLCLCVSVHALCQGFRSYLFSQNNYAKPLYSISTPINFNI